jgi:hypothetical protein
MVPTYCAEKLKDVNIKHLDWCLAHECLTNVSYCYSLYLKCPQEVHVLNAWSPVGGAILEVLEALEGGRSLRWVLWGILSLPPSSFNLCFLSVMR